MSSGERPAQEGAGSDSLTTSDGPRRAQQATDVKALLVSMGFRPDLVDQALDVLAQNPTPRDDTSTAASAGYVSDSVMEWLFQHNADDALENGQASSSVHLPQTVDSPSVSASSPGLQGPARSDSPSFQPVVPENGRMRDKNEELSAAVDGGASVCAGTGLAVRVVEAAGSDKGSSHVEESTQRNSSDDGMDDVRQRCPQCVTTSLASPRGVEPMCRICLEYEQGLDTKLISPCGCDGTMKFVHETCLNTWLSGWGKDKELQDPFAEIDWNTDPAQNPRATCEICKTRYVTRTVIEASWRKIWAHVLRCCAYGLLLLIAIGFDVGVTFFMVAAQYSSGAYEDMDWQQVSYITMAGMAILALYGFTFVAFLETRRHLALQWRRSITRVIVVGDSYHEATTQVVKHEDTPENAAEARTVDNQGVPQAQTDPTNLRDAPTSTGSLIEDMPHATGDAEESSTRHDPLPVSSSELQLSIIPLPTSVESGGPVPTPEPASINTTTS